MMLRALLFVVLIAGNADADVDHGKIAETTLQTRILPAAMRFQDGTDRFHALVQKCGPVRIGPLRHGYDALWDDWLALSVYKFGPLETDARFLQIAFWPDPRGSTQRTLAKLIAAQDPIVGEPEAFARSSIAGRGLFALERVLFGEADLTPYTCDLVRAIATDLRRTAAIISAEWTGPWATLIRTAGQPGNDRFLDPKEATQRIFGALIGALDFTIELRLQRPLGTLERPRPKRAEAWRSGRALANVEGTVREVLALYRGGLRERISHEGRKELDLAAASVETALERTRGIGSLGAAVVSAQRIRIDALEAALTGLRDAMAEVLGPELGVTRGFNARDGD